MAVDLAPTGLPVEEAVPAVREALAGPGSAVLRADPGAGKTTVVPLRLLDEPWLGVQRIVVLEPRRLAARAAARRMADLLGEPVGRTVGFRTRDERKVGAATRVEVVTEGILTRRLQADPSLPGTGLVVFDEVHERHLQTDLALALALDARAGLRPDLRLLAMSATLETDRLATLVDGPVIDSPGRTFSVDVRWREPVGRVPEVAVVHEALRSDEGDVLVFLAGAGEIHRLAGALTDLPAGVDVRPLHGSLSPAEQDRALAPSPAGRRRVVLATDIAESSLTVEGVRIVVDGGRVRRPRYDARSGLSRLQTQTASQAAAEQRAGRAGRLGPGVAYRLWSAAEHHRRRAHPEPEIRHADLAGLALELAVWGAGAGGLPFLDPPPAQALADARLLLTRLGALDEGGRPTAAGRAMVDLPLHPRLARMVVEDGTPTAVALAALLEERDPLRAPPDVHRADVAERLRLLAADDPRAATVRRRQRELARRAGVGGGTVRTVDLGPVLALAHPRPRFSYFLTRC
ncbi:MAG TPA: ATP-dependent helicase HrpB, partial [Acidimicrobiales bacterium]|nr:ATP-dependent helicase HrpB [Acidimicrobiales bacterium]